MARTKPTTQINSYDEELAQFAQAAAAEKAKAAGSTNRVSLKAGLINVGGTNRGTSVPVIILADEAQKAHYRGAYNPANPEGPVCFAFQPEEGQPFTPHPDSVQKQCANCTDCPHNEFGTAKRQDGSMGAGKACNDYQRLIAVVGDYKDGKVVLPAIDTAPLWQIQVPATSIRNWAAFVVGTANVAKRPPFGVVTRMYTVPDQKSQFKVMFDLERNLTAEEYAQVRPRRDEAAELCKAPYVTILQSAQPAAAPAAGGRKKKYT